MVLAGLAAGKVVALNLGNGNVLWEVTLAQPKGANELERITDIAGAPVGGGGPGVRGHVSGPRGLLRHRARRVDLEPRSLLLGGARRSIRSRCT